MRGITGFGAYLPYRRLDRSTIAAVAGTGGGKGTRTVAGFDEDTTTMGAEAARRALRAAPDGAPVPGMLLFSTVAPAYADKTNATAIHAALRLPAAAAVLDMNGAVRSSMGALGLALDGSVDTLVVGSDIRFGLAGSADEAAGGDGAAAFLVGDDSQTSSAPVLAELIGAASVTHEFLDRWRTPGDIRSKRWEERFGELQYVPLGTEAWKAALHAAGLEPEQVHHVAIASTHARAARSLGRGLGLAAGVLVDDLAATVGNTGAAHPLLLLQAALERAEPNQVIALVSLADGADVLLFRTTDAIAGYEPAVPLTEQAAAGAGAPIPYGKYLAWRGLITPEPPRRPEPARPSSSAAARSDEWKFGFVGSRDRVTGAVHLPPQRASARGTAVDEMDPVAMADAHGTVVTFTIDKLAYSPSPPVVFAVIDFDGGGRLPMELTDVDPGEVTVGQRVEMTFRKLFTADGIHDYFWKARPRRDGAKGD